MKRIPVIHLARVLRVLILAVLVMNILCLLLVPGIVAYVSDGGPAALAQAAQAELQAWLNAWLNAWQGREAETHFPMLAVFLAAWPAVWTRLDTALLTLFYWLCGGLYRSDPVAGQESAGYHFDPDTFPAGQRRGAEASGGVLLGDLRCGSGAAGAVAVERGKRVASVYLYRAVYPGLFHGRPAVPGHVRPVPAGGGAERGSGPDHLRERGRAWGSW